MKKKINSVIMFAMAAVLSVSLLAGCSGSTASTIGGTDAATDIVIESQETEAETSEKSAQIEESEVAIERLGDGTEDDGEEDVYIEMNPVAKWGTIASVDEENNRIHFNSNEYFVDEEGNYTDTVQEIVLNLTDSTPILDAETLMPVQLSDIDLTANVYVWVSQAMTMSLPPQTAAQVIIVNVPEDASAPMYVVAKEVEKTDDGVIITDQDGVKWRADADTQVSPYLTRNIVTLDDIEVGSRFVLSQDQEESTSGSEKAGEADGYAARIVLFAD